MNDVMPDLSSTYPGRPLYEDHLYRPRAAHLSRPIHKAKHRAGNLVVYYPVPFFTLICKIYCKMKCNCSSGVFKPISFVLVLLPT